MTSEPFSDQFTDCTDSITVDIAVRVGGGQWPSMIGLDFYEAGGTILSSDAYELARMLIEAARSCDHLDAEHLESAQGEPSDD